jgi:hypothetical protein
MVLGRAAAAAVVAAEEVTAAGGVFFASDAQPAIAVTAPTTATVLHLRRRLGAHRILPIYATLAAVMPRIGFWECCRL